MKLPIKNVKPQNIGNSYYFLIPAQYIRNEAVSIDGNYNILISDND